MIPILYESLLYKQENGETVETTFNHGGLGWLKDCTKCTATEKLNGEYECEFSYPITGQHYSEISHDRIVKVKPNETSDPQLFRIYRDTRPVGGIVRFFSQHISYDLNGNDVTPFTQSGANVTTVLTDILEHCYYNHRFSAVSYTGSSCSFEVKVPTSARKCLGGMEGSILDKVHGEFEFDNFTIKHYNSRGQDNGVVIQYGKNLTDVSADTSIADTYTSIYPYALDEDGEYYELPEKVIELPSSSNYGEPKMLPLDLSKKFDSETRITETLLRQYANEFISNNGIDQISQNLKVSFVQLWQSKEYETIAILERVKLGDTVTVKYPALGVSVKARVIKTVYDVLNEKYIEIELGQSKNNFANTLNEVHSEFQTMSDFMRTQPSLMEKAIAHATERITGGLGGYVIIGQDTQTGYPEEILIMDTPDKTTATNVWRFNSGGLGHSHSGYNGPFDDIALTDDGQINANMITTGILNADLIKAGTIKSVNNNMSVNMQTGKIDMTVTNGKALEIWTQGITMYSANDDVLASMYVSTGGLGIMTANRMLVGIRGSERVTISADSSNGYVRADMIYADTVSANANSGISVSNDTSITGALSVSNGASITGALSVSNGASITGTLSASGNISAGSVSATSMITADYAVRSQRFALEKSNNTYENVLMVSNGNTLISSDIAEIKALKVYDTANSAFREFEFKRISVMNADTGNTELMRILVQKE